MYTQPEPHAIGLIRTMGLDAFCEEFKISRNAADGLVSLKYDQVRSPMEHPAVQDCRGMIVREDDPTCLVAFPYRKFFNLGESRAATIDWHSARVLEKLDGSLIIMYFDHRLGQRRWRVATSGQPVAGGPYNGFGKTFEEVFWETWLELGYQVPIHPEHPMDDVWYFFELCRPDNRIVVKYESPRLVLHGARRRAGLLELGWEELHAHACRYGWEAVSDWRRDGMAMNAARVTEAASITDPLGLEGFVVVDRHFKRVKVKNPAYVELHHLRGNGVRSPRSVVECVKRGEVDEILAHFPDMREQFDPITEAIDAAADLISLKLARFGALDRKSFALEVKDVPFSNAAFRLYGQGIVPSEIVRARILEMTTPAILRALGMRDEGAAADE